MSSYIFRKYPGYNPNEIQDWSQSTGIDPASFDPENIAFGRGASKAGTSIPSPMARLELFDTAFQIVASDRGNLDGNTIYHQLVSDCLDVFQLLFNAKVVNEKGELDEEKAATLVEKYGTEFSDRLNRNNNSSQTIIIKEEPKSGVNINIGR